MTDADFTPRRSARVAQKRGSEAISNPSTPAVRDTKKQKAVAEKTESLKVGDELPNIVLKDQNDQDVNLLEISADSTVVVFAYPKASTPGCTKQACGFRDNYPEFESSKAKVFGISADSVNAQKNFETKQKLPYQLLSDPKYQLIGPLGAKKSAKGGIVRSHWIIQNKKIVLSAVGISPQDSFTKALEYVTNSSGEAKAEVAEVEKTEEPKQEEKTEEPTVKEPEESEVTKEESEDKSKNASTEEESTTESKEETKEEAKEETAKKESDEEKPEDTNTAEVPENENSK